MQHHQLKKLKPKLKKSLVKYKSFPYNSRPKGSLLADVHILILVTHGVGAMDITKTGSMIATGVTFEISRIAVVHCIIACDILLLFLYFLWLFHKRNTPMGNCEMKKRSQEDTVWTTGRWKRLKKRLKDHNCLKHCQGYSSVSLR